MPVPESELEAYISNTLATLDNPYSRDAELPKLIKQSLRLGLQRLNLVPEDDPFWQGTNLKPTIYQLGDYFQTVLVKDPKDEQARWVLIALALYHASNGFGSDLLLPLIARDVRVVRWLVSAAEWVWYRSGYDTTTLLRASLNQLRASIGGFDKAVEGLTEDPDPQVGRLAIVAQRVLDGKRINAAD